MRKKLVDSAVGATQTGIVAAALFACEPHVAAAAAVIKPFADLFLDRWTQATDARLRASTSGLLEAVAESGTYDAKEADARLTMVLSSTKPEVQDMAYAQGIALLTSRTRAAWPYILRVTAECIVHRGGVPDAFFTRALWLLERCEDGDIEFLRAALSRSEAVLRSLSSPSQAGIEWSYQGHQGVRITINPEPDPPFEPSYVEGDQGRLGADVVELLGESRLGFMRTGLLHFPVAEGHITRLINLFRFEDQGHERSAGS